MQRTIDSSMGSLAGNQFDSSLEGPFIMECVLPAQVNEKRAALSGEERLLLAVLEDAVNCFFGEDSQARIESTLWFQDRAYLGPFSFENICDIFGLDSGWLRKGLFRRRALLRQREAPSMSVVRFSRAA